MDLEDKKILNKRKKRTVKIEERTFDIESFFRQRKIFDPSSTESSEESEKNSERFTLDKMKIRLKMLHSYF